MSMGCGRFILGDHDEGRPQGSTPRTSCYHLFSGGCAMFKRVICAAGILGMLVSCAAITPEDAARLEAYHRVFHPKGASNAMTMQDMIDLGLARRVNLADPAFPPK
jgi:hypothetical protein